MKQILAVLVVTLLSAVYLAAQTTRVTVLRTPHHGHRPQAVVDDQGVLHVVQGDTTRRGDVFYTRRKKGGEFSAPIRVNTTPGIVAGFSMAVGAGGRVHVLIRTNPKYSRLKMPGKKKLRIFDLKYMLYARLADDGKSFEKERNLAGPTIAFEGMGVVLADGKDVVRAYWHGQLEAKFNEPGRKIYTVISTDAGETFSEQRPIRSDVVGACQCCAMAGTLDAKGNIYLSFRNSRPLEKGLSKDSYLLVSKDAGATFRGELLEEWHHAGCPGSTTTLASAPSGVFVTWSTRGMVRMARSTDLGKRTTMEGRKRFRAPRVVSNHRGEILFVATSVVPRSRGAGDVFWKLLDAKGELLAPRGQLPMGAAAGWGGVTAFAEPNGDFVILHDGAGRRSGKVEVPPGKRTHRRRSGKQTHQNR